MASLTTANREVAGTIDGVEVAEVSEADTEMRDGTMDAW